MENIDKDKLKNELITALYKSGEVHRNVKNLCSRFVPKETYIYEDIIQNGFLELSRKPAEYIIKIYNLPRSDGKQLKNLEGLIIRIIQLKTWTRDAKADEYVKNRWGWELLAFSNLKYGLEISTQEGDRE